MILPVSWRCARSTLRSNAFQGVRIPTRTQVVASFMRCKPVVGKPVEARLGGARLIRKRAYLNPFPCIPLRS